MFQSCWRAVARRWYSVLPGRGRSAGLGRLRLLVEQLEERSLPSTTSSLFPVSLLPGGGGPREVPVEREAHAPAGRHAGKVGGPQAALVRSLYHAYLHQKATPAQLAQGVHFLAGGGAIDQLKAQLLGSPTYFRVRAHHNVNRFLAAVAQDVLGHPLDAATLQQDTALLTHGASRSTVALLIVQLAEPAPPPVVPPNPPGPPNPLPGPAPTLAIGSPRTGLLTDTDPAIQGQVSAGAVLQAQVDAAAAVAVPVGATGAFTFTPGLPLDGSHDGTHTVLFRATDPGSGLASTASFSFTLDTLPPAVTVQSPTAGQALDASVTSLAVGGVATDAGSGVAVVQAAVDGGTPVALTFSATTGDFTGTLPLTGLATGGHTLHVLAGDRAGNTGDTDVAFTLGQATQAPVLPPVGPLTVAPGGYLAVPLNATDPGGFPLTYSLRGGAALPTGGLQAEGTLVFQPAPAEVGTYTFTVAVSDGTFETTQPVTLTVAGTPQATTSISGVVEDTSGNPVAGVPVRLGGLRTTTAADGTYTLTYSGTLPGTLLEVDADQAPGAASYAGFSAPLDQLTTRPIYPGFTNVIGRPLYLAPLDTAGAVTVDPGQDTTVTSSTMPGASLLIPAGGLRDQNGNLYTGKVSLTVLPAGRTPVPLPGDQHPGLAVLIAPVGSLGTQLALTGGVLTLPNVSGYLPGTKMGVLGPVPGGAAGFTEIASFANAVVSSDGKTVKTPPFNLFPPPSPLPDQSQKPPPQIICVYNVWYDEFGSPHPDHYHIKKDPPCDCEDGVGSPPWPSGSPAQPPVPGTQDPSPWLPDLPVALGQSATAHGSLEQDQVVGGYHSQGQSRQLVLHYESLQADPTNVIHVDLTINGGAYGMTDPRIITSLVLEDGTFTIPMPGAPGGALLPGQTLQYFRLPATGHEADIGIQADTSNLPSGVYTYALTSGIINNAGTLLAGTLQTLVGSVIVVNSQASPFGSGWGLSGLEQLFPGADGSLLLADGDGTRLVFDAPQVPGGAYVSPPGDFSTLVRLPDGTYRRTLPDQTVYTFNTAGQLTTIEDANGNTTKFDYAFGRLISLTDPVGEKTTVLYTGNTVSSITTPDGKVTQLHYDSSGNLTSVVLPGGAAGQYGYSGPHLLTTATDPDGHVSTDAYNAFGRVVKMTNGAGQSTGFSTPDTLDVLPFAATLSPATAPTALPPQPFVETITDGNGNVTTRTLNDAFEVVSWSDGTGAGASYQRTNDLVTSVTDGNGNVTRYAYQNGNVVLIQDSVSGSAAAGGTVANPADQNVYTFTGTAGERVFYEDLGGFAPGSGLSGTLAAPSGATVYAVGASAGTADAPLTLTESGTYTLTFTTDPVAFGSGAGGYRFALVDTAGATSVPLNTPVSKYLDPAQGEDLFQLTGSAGERLHFHSLGASDPGSWTVYAPDDTSLATGPLTSDFEATLPVAGTYLLALGPTGTGPSSFGFEVDAVTTTTAALTLGTPAAAAIAAPGDERRFTFSGQAGQRVYLDAGSAAATAQLLAPDGAATPLASHVTNYVTSQGESVSFTTNAAPVTLTQTGTYTLALTGSVPGTDPLTLSDAAALPALPLGQAVRGDVASGAAAYALSGQAGHQLQLSVREGKDLVWTLYGPENQVIAENDPANETNLPYLTHADVGPNFLATLPEDGTYVLTVQATGLGGPPGYNFSVADVTPAPVAASGFGTVHSGTLAAGQQATFTFTAPAGLPVLLDDQSGPNTYFQYELGDVNHPPALTGGVASGSAGSDLGPLTLPDAGTYTLVVNNYTSSTESYQFRLLDLSGAPALTLGQTVSVTPGAANETEVYRVATTPGQQLFFDPLVAPFSQGTVALAAVGTGSPVTGGSGILADQVFGPQTGGTRYLLVSTQASTAYGFQLVDPATAAPATFNTQVGGSLASPGQTDLYQFAGTAGQYVYLDQGQSIYAAVTLYGPEGQTVNTSSSTGGSGGTLPETGTYAVAVSRSPYATGSVSYTLNVRTPATNTAALTEGALTGGTLATPGQRDQYTFPGTAGEQVFVGGNAPLTGPEGESLTPLANGFAGSAYTLPEAGTYTATATGAQAGPYQFRLADGATAPLLALDTPVTATIQFTGDFALYRFTATAGEAVALTGTAASLATIYDGNGQPVTLPANGQLPAAGTYLIVVSPRSIVTYPASYGLKVVLYTTTPLTFGTTTSGTLAQPLDQQHFTFTGTVGQRLCVNVGSFNPTWTARLVDPSGTSVLWTQGQPFTLTSGGTYTLSVAASSTGASFSFRVLDVASAPALALGTPESGTLNPGTDIALYTFPGKTGQRLSFQAVPGSGDASADWQLFGPFDGEMVASSGPGLSLNALLPINGTYILVIQGTSTSGPVNYGFQATDVSDKPVAASGLGTVQSGTVAAGGTTTVTFTAPAGLPVFFDNQDAADSPIGFTCLEPSGNTLFTAGGSADQGPVYLPYSGTYTVQVANAGSASATYAFRLLDLTAVPAVTLGTTVTGTLATGLQTDVYRLNGRAVQQIAVNGSLTDLSNVTLRLWHPGQFAGPVPQTVFTLPSDGTYYVIVTGQQPAGGSYSFHWDDATALPPVTAGTFLTSSSAPYRFAGTAGQRLYFAEGNTGVSDTFEYTLQLYGPGGQVFGQLAGRGYLATLPSTGTYVLMPFKVYPGASTSYSFQFNVPSTTTAAAPSPSGTFAEHITYDPKFSIPTSFTDFLGHQTLFQLDPNTGNVLRVTRVAGPGGAGSVVTRYTYAPNGQVQTMTDALGNVTKYAYDARGQLTQTTYASGTAVQGSVTYAYDASGNLISYTDENGHRSTYQYDALNRPLSITDPLGNVTQSTYDAAGNLFQLTDPGGNVTKYTYNGANQLATATSADSGVVQDQYDPAGNLAAATDPLGHQTQFQYDARDRPIATIDATGGRTSQTYDHDNNVLTATDADGRATTYTYDSRSRLIGITDPLGHTSTSVYDADNDLLSVTDGNGNTTTYGYDDLNRLVQVTDPMHAAQSAAYDGDGNLIQSTDPLGFTTTYAYDARNRLVAVTDALGNVTRSTYDPAGNLLTATDPLGHVTSYTYDADNQLLTTTDAAGNSASQTYDAAGNLVTATDELGRTITYTYDALNRLTTTTDPMGGKSTVAYDLAGNVISSTDPLGNETTYAYDALNRPTLVADALGGVTATTYDAVGNVLTATDALGRVTQNTYDGDNRLTTVTDALGGVTAYTYDAAGNQLTATDPLGRTTTFGYDADNRLTTTTDPLGNVTTAAYDAAGNVVTTTDALNRTTHFTYDALGRLVTTMDPLGAGLPRCYVTPLPARTLAVDRWLPFLYAFRFGAFFFGPRGDFLYLAKSTFLATSLSTSAISCGLSLAHHVQCFGGIATIIPGYICSISKAK